MSKSIYELGLHQTTELNGIFIRRVPGGWLYEPTEGDIYSTFVPYDNEFDKPESSIGKSLIVENEMLRGHIANLNYQLELSKPT